MTLGKNVQVTVNAGVLTVGGAIGDGGSGFGLSKAGAGTLTIAGANTYSGGTTVNAGTLNVTVTLSSAGSLTVNGGTVNFSNSQQVSSLSGSGGIISFGSGKFLTLATASSSSYFGTLQGSGGLVLSSGATATLGGGYSYNGPTLIHSGARLNLNAPTHQSSTSSYTLAGGTLALLGNTNLAAGTLNVTANSIIDFTSTTNAGIISFATSTTPWSGNLTLQNYDTSAPRLRFGSDSSGLGDNISRISVQGFAGSISVGSDGYLQLTAVPEPSTYAAMVGVAALGAAVYHRRRMRAAVVAVPAKA